MNKWACWCGPCRLEFPWFRDQAEKRKGEIVFIGVNSNDNRGDAEDFLKEEPVPFKHFEDPKLEIAAAMNAVQAFPSTAYYDSKGELAFVHQGGYSNEDDWRRTSTATPADVDVREARTDEEVAAALGCASACSAASRASPSRRTRTAATPRPPTSWRLRMEP